MRKRCKGKTKPVKPMLPYWKTLRHWSKLKRQNGSRKISNTAEKTQPIIDKLHHWVIENKDKVPPKSKLVEALIYWCNQEHKLITYLKDGRINIDNNHAERAMKPFVIGRKNWLFSNTARGATANTVLHSIIEIAKTNGMLVDSYLQTCLDGLANKPESLTHLLPWNVKQG